MATLAHINLLRISLVTFFALQLYSCKKLTHETINIDVVVMNDITQKPEPEEEVILVERKEKFTGLMGLSYEDNVLARGTSNANGVINFGVRDLKRRKKFSYLVILQYKSNYSNYQHVIDEVILDINNSNNFMKLSFGPTMTGLFSSPSTPILPNSGDTYYISAKSEYRKRKGLLTNNDSLFFSPSSQEEFSRMKIRETSMGEYYITLIRLKNGIKDTLRDTIFCPRDQDYIYEFEF
jgi:hypothetical protein